jgi:hypothetical protein
MALTQVPDQPRLCDDLADTELGMVFQGSSSRLHKRTHINILRCLCTVLQSCVAWVSFPHPSAVVHESGYMAATDM